MHSGSRTLGERSASRGDAAIGGGAGSKEEGEKGSPTGIDVYKRQRVGQRHHLFESYQQMVHLCIVMEIFSRKAISCQLSAKPDVELVITAFQKAYGKRNNPYGLKFHSDRGMQYTAFSFR